MDDARKNAYRFLLYWAMLEIRLLEHVAHRPWRLLNPFTLRRALRDAARAGAVANWLHNLAQYAADDFRDFDEAWFWRDYDWLVQRHGDGCGYRDVFDRRLAEPARPPTVG